MGQEEFLIESNPINPDMNSPDEQEDRAIAIARLKDNLPSVPLEEVIKQLGFKEQNWRLN